MSEPSLKQKIIKNPLALSGLIIIVIMSTLIIGAPLFTPFKPTDQRNWLGAKPPGFSHPDVITENRFIVGQTPESTKICIEATTIEIHQTETKTDEVRILKDKEGLIKSIKLNNESLDSIDLKDYPFIEDISNDSKHTHQIPKEKVEVGQPASLNLMEESQRVLLLKITQKASDKVIRINVENKIVKNININNKEEISQIAIKGSDVTQLQINNQMANVSHFLGTDEMGRDLFSRILFGGRISLMVGFVATFVSLIIGVFYGAISGYFGGKVDRLMMSTVDILYAIPFMFLVIILMVSFGRSLILLFVALGAVQWLTMSRIVRGQMLSLKEMEFVEAARMCGSNSSKIILKHLLPHTLGPVIVYTSLTVPVVILEESFLAFIGLQVQMNGLSLDSWGTLIDNGIKALGHEGERMWLLLYPSIAMMITLFGLNAFGDGLRDILDPKASRRSN